MSFSFSYTPPEYLQLTHTGLIYFRYRVPSSLRFIIGKTELKYSLKTRSIRTARQYLASILPFIEGLFRDIQSETLSSTNINRIIKETISRIRTPDHSPTVITPDKLSPSHQTTSVPESVTQDEEEKTSFIELQASFFKEKKLSKGWRPKTLEDHEQVFSLFVEVFGDIPVDSIDKAKMREFKATIAELPPNMRKVKKYRDKSIPQILRVKPERTLSSHTINKYISRLSNLFSYGVSHGFINSNPAGGLKVKLKCRPDEERETYSKEDLKKIFGAREFTTPKGGNPHSHKHSYGYWVPLIGLYTGCRLEEICQLHLEDIRKEQGIWVLDINDNFEKHLKTLSSTRLIPVHPKLIEMGLIDHMKKLKSGGETRLFPELQKHRDGYSQDVSKWYRRFKQKLGFDSSKNFHSFRHTFITHLKHKQVDPFILHELDGHTIKSETMGRYGKRFTADILLKEAIEKIDYEIEHM